MNDIFETGEDEIRSGPRKARKTPKSNPAKSNSSTGN